MRAMNAIGRGGVAILVSLLAVSKAPALPGAQTSAPVDYTVIWRSVEADDYLTYVANLRTIGVPPETIQDIVTAELSRSFDAESKTALDAFYAARPYWKSDTNQAAAELQLINQRGAIISGTTSSLQTLFGADVPLPDFAARWNHAQLDAKLGFLSSEKRTTVEAILDSHAMVDQQAQSLSEGTKVSNDADERDRIVASHLEGRKLLREALTGDEFDRVEMVTSWTGDNLRQAMSHFEPTEAEFRMIFAPWRAHDEELVGTYAARQPDPGNAGVYEKIRKQMNPQRYAQYVEAWWK